MLFDRKQPAAMLPSTAPIDADDHAQKESWLASLKQLENLSFLQQITLWMVVKKLLWQEKGDVLPVTSGDQSGQQVAYTSSIKSALTSLASNASSLASNASSVVSTASSAVSNSSLLHVLPKWQSRQPVHLEATNV